MNFLKREPSLKEQKIFNSYYDFLDQTSFLDRIVMIMIYDFDVESSFYKDLITKLKSSNARIHVFKISNCSHTIENILEICDFMEKFNINSVIAIGEDFLGEFLKAINVFYNNSSIKTLSELEHRKHSLTYKKLKETIFIPTTGGGTEAHRYFKIIDNNFSQITIFEDSMDKIDILVVDANIVRESSLDYIMYYIFSVIANVIDILLIDDLDKEIKTKSLSMINKLVELLENGEGFGNSLLFREKVISYSFSVSKMVDEVGYGILYLYGNLIEGVFSVPRNTIDALGIEFFVREIRDKNSSMKLSKCFDMNDNFEENIRKLKKIYGAKDNLSFYSLNEEMVDKVKNVALNFLYTHGIIEKYRSLNFNGELNDKLFNYYLEGIDS